MFCGFLKSEQNASFSPRGLKYSTVPIGIEGAVAIFCSVISDLCMLPPPLLPLLWHVGSEPEPQSPSGRQLHEDRFVNSFCQQKVAGVWSIFH